ncbi:MAG: aldo/keto reductase [Lachnospiraceae bacterium]|nr:aldo/keto reductase [Lachnospiraceae bacterium]
MWEEELTSKSDTVTLRNGIRIPCIGFGTWKLTPEEAKEGVLEAIKAGYTHIDTATAYQNEEGVGRALKESGLRRDEVFVTTKLPNADHGYFKAMDSLKGALLRLGLDHVDLYLIHWPVIDTFKDRFEEDICETWRALLEMEKEGIVRVPGVSNFMVKHLKVIEENGLKLPFVDQIQFNPQCIDTELRAFLEEKKILCEGWSPLAQGRVFGYEKLSALAEKYSCDVAQLCVRFALQSHVIPLPKSKTPYRIASNANVFDFKISDEDMKIIESHSSYGRIGNEPDVPRVEQVVGFTVK